MDQMLSRSEILEECMVDHADQPRGPGRSMSVETHKANQELGTIIRAARRGRGLTLQAVADVIGISHQQMQKYERGANRVSGLRLAQIAALLGTTPDKLLAKAMGDAGAPLLAPGCQSLNAGDYLREEEVSLLRLYRGIRSRDRREAVLLCLRALTDESGGQSGPLPKPVRS